MLRDHLLLPPKTPSLVTFGLFLVTGVAKHWANVVLQISILSLLLGPQEFKSPVCMPKGNRVFSVEKLKSHRPQLYAMTFFLVLEVIFIQGYPRRYLVLHFRKYEAEESSVDVLIYWYNIDRL